MSDSKRPSRTRSDADIDISTSSSSQWMNPKVNWTHWTFWFVIVMAVMALYQFVEWDWPIEWILLAGPGLLIVGMVGWLTWILGVRRGIFTWMRLAQQPAIAMARGDAVAAEAAYAKALARAQRFAPNDQRRGAMLGELAAYVKNQGRYPEAIALFEEGLDILVQHQHADPFCYYLIGLGNYANCFIHLKDYSAAQRMLEKILDLTLAARKREYNTFARGIQIQQIQAIEFVLKMNLIFLLIEMKELAQAELHLREAQSKLKGLTKRNRANYGDHYVGLRALWEYASGHFADAGHEVEKAQNPDYPTCLRVRAKLHLVRLEFAAAEELLQQFQKLERKKGSLHRPELLDQTLDMAASLYGQGNHEAAFTTLQEARAIVADFALPPDAAWRKTLEGWLQRARELGNADVAGSLEAELQKMPATEQHAITILEKFRIHPPTAG